VCDLDMMGAPSKLSVPRGGSGRIHDLIALTELLKLQKSGQFPDEPVRIKV
jgi:hypothetical protein